MNKFILAYIAGGCLFYGACTHHPQPASQPADTLSSPDTAQKTYFPVADVLESEILQIDSTPVAIKKLTISAGKKDSAFIKPAEFNTLASAFLAPEFRNGTFEKNYTETSFIDNANQAATFTYSTTNNTLSLQRVDIVTTPQGTSHQVSSVYMEKKRVSGDSSILDKMYWRSGHRFHVVSLINVKGHAPVERQLIVSWESGGDTDQDNE
jgi:hypothetical protein